MKKELPGRVRKSAYMEWVKLNAGARYNLATSGVAFCPLSFLETTLSDLEINGPSFYGYEPLRTAVAQHSGVDPSCVVLTEGTSMANHLAMAVLLEPGDEVVIETPTYELLISTAEYLGAKVRRFAREPGNRFAIDPEVVRRTISRHTKLIMVTNLHNPSSMPCEDSTLCMIGELARAVGARVLVDEVYLEALDPFPPRSAFHLGPSFLSTNSLTKVYGLNGLRCGWVLAEAELAQRMWRLNDLFGVIPAHPAERLSAIAFQQLDRVRERSRSLLAANWRIFDQVLGDCDALEIARPPAGTVIFPRLKSTRVAELCHILRDRYETSVTPGFFFGAPDHFRIGLGGEMQIVREGLSRVRQAIAELERAT